MKKALLIIGIVGMLLSIAVVGVSFVLFLTNRPRISLQESMFGIVPGLICCFLFLVLAVTGLLMMVLMKPKDEAEGASSRRKRRASDEEEEDN
jgi:hypothetical protein